ncbi:MAG: hypothetical protein IKH22_05685, partial [Prevotella sp.]|nr:hypothetical protein [Prevotella sp.]
RRGKYYSITRKPQGGRVKLQWLFEIDGCPDICLAGQFVFKFIEERYAFLAKTTSRRAIFFIIVYLLTSQS